MMDMYKKYKSALGYEVGDNGIDSYGVDHSGFSTRDELNYQFARDKREGELIDYYQRQGINDNYPQFGTDFWGNDSADNYGFGSSDIEGKIDNHPALNQTPFPQRMENWSYDTFGSQPNDHIQEKIAQDFNFSNKGSDVWSQQDRRSVENDLLMDGMDTLYGMNRTINGMSFGGLDWLGQKLGVDTQMRGYLDLKDEESRRLAQMAGNAAELGGAVMTGRPLNNAARYGYDQANMAYNGYKIGRKYDQLVQDPFQGSGRDVIARMKNHNGEPVVLQRGEAIVGENGKVIVHGKALGRETGTVRNYGLDKGIYRHGVAREDAQNIPKIIRQKPLETSPRGQYIYSVPNKNGSFQVVTSPTNEGITISSIYYPKK